MMVNIASDDTLVSAVSEINQIVNSIYSKQISYGPNGVYNSSSKEVFEMDTGVHQEQSHRFHATHAKPSGELENIQYTQLYRPELLEIYKILNGLSVINEEFEDLCKTYLKVIENNNRLELEAWRLGNTSKFLPYVWNFGPIESMADRFFGVKKFFSSLLLSVSKDHQGSIDTIVDQSLSFARRLPVNGSIVPEKKSQIYVGNMISWAGEIASIGPVGWSRPENTKLVQSYGSIKQIYMNNLNKKVEQLYIPIAELLGLEYISDFMKNHYVEVVVLHELCHTIGKFNGYKNRFDSQYDIFEEIRTDFLSYVLAKDLEDRGFLEKGFTENMIISNIIVGLHMCYLWYYKKQRKAYAHIFYHILFVLSDYIILDKSLSLECSVDTKAYNKIFLESNSLLSLAKKGDKDDVIRIIERDRSFSENKVNPFLEKMKEANIPLSFEH